MVKSGKFTVNQPSIFGRIGTGVGKGLAEQLPKEMDRGRLSEGLNQFAQKSNDPLMKQYAQLLSIPGITPQAVQTFGELAKQQSSRNAYANRSRGSNQENQPNPGFNLNEAPQFGQLPGKVQRQNNGGYQEPSELVRPEETGQPQVSPPNPTRPEALPGIPWTQDQYLDSVAKYAEQFPNDNPASWEQRARGEEARMLSRPEAFQRYDQYLKDKSTEIESEFNKQLKLHLQKEGGETFKDVPGDLQSNMIRTIERRIKQNPRLNVADAVKEGVNQLFEFSKSKNKVDELATKPFYDFLTPSKRDANYKSLGAISNIYNELDRNDELFQKLRSHSTPVEKDAQGNVVKPQVIGFGLSPQEAAALSYPVKNQPELKSYIDNVKPKKIKFGAGTIGGIKGGGPFEDTAKDAVSHAINIEKYLNDPKASILAIAKELKGKDPYFNERAFFDQIRQDSEEGRIKLWPFQKNELINAESDVSPNWGDLWFLPRF